MSELLKHETECLLFDFNELDEIKLNNCKLCNEILAKSGIEAKNDPSFIHFCDNIDRNVCKDHK